MTWGNCCSNWAQLLKRKVKKMNQEGTDCSRFLFLQVASSAASESAWRRTPSRSIRPSFWRWLRSNAQRGRKATCTESRPPRRLLLGKRRRRTANHCWGLRWWWRRSLQCIRLFVERDCPAAVHHYYSKYYTRMTGQEFVDGFQWRGSIWRGLRRPTMDLSSVFKGQLQNVLVVRRYPNRS